MESFRSAPFRLRGGVLVPPWSTYHRVLLSVLLQGSHRVVSRSSGFSPPRGYPASQALSPQYYPWLCQPLPPSRSGIAVTGSVFYGLFRPQGRRTSRGKTHSLSVSRPTSVHGGDSNRIWGLALPRLLAPLRTPIWLVYCSLRTRVLPQASFRHPISGHALAVLAFPFRPIAVGFRFTSFLFAVSVSCPAHVRHPRQSRWLDE